MEIWKDIFYFDHCKKELVDYRGYYSVSNLGNVKSLKRIDNNNHKIKERILKNKTDKLGYKRINLCKDGISKTFSVHRLVAFMFVENDNTSIKTQVNHIDENPSNNNVENLEWCDCKYNINYGKHNERCAKSREGFKHSEETKEKISFMTKGENNHMYGKHHTDDVRKRQQEMRENPIIGVHINNKTIIRFISIREAERNGFNRCCIMDCFKGKQKQHNGYMWFKEYYVKLPDKR